MARKLCKSTIRELMSYWGRKGGSRATQKQKDAARENLRKTPTTRNTHSLHRPSLRVTQIHLLKGSSNGLASARSRNHNRVNEAADGIKGRTDL
jgi:hypothetical protein